MLANDGIVEFLNATGRDDSAPIENVELIRDGPGEVNILFHEQDADLSLGLDSDERLADLIDDVRLDAFGRFIEDEHLGIREQRARWPIVAAVRLSTPPLRWSIS